MTRRIRNLHDFLEAVKMIPFALVIAGYVFLAAWVTGWLAANGWPVWLAFCALIAITVFGLWQAYLFFTAWEKIRRKLNKPSGHDNQRDNDNHG